MMGVVMDNIIKFNFLVKERIYPVLKSRGFKKGNLTWNKDYYEFIQVINIQKSKYSSTEIVDFTINLGVFSSKVFEIIWNKKSPKIIKEENCILRSRIGQILQNNFEGSAKDKWWRIENTTDVEKLSSEIILNIENLTLPFLDDFVNFSKIYDFLINLKGWQSKVPQQRLNLAIVAHELGKITVAQDIISEINRQHEPWQKRCHIVAKNIGLTIWDGMSAE